jgi:CheY-like chemotaxis protein
MNPSSVDTNAHSSYKLLGDQPYVGDDDPFGFVAIADELATLILRSRRATPFTIGIEASWGRGKSSLMGQLRRRLAGEAPALVVQEGSDRVEVRSVSFNAWTAEGSDVLEGLIKSVLDAMDPNALRRALRNERLVSGLRIPLLILGGLVRMGPLADEVWNRLSVDARRRNQINHLVREAMLEWRMRAVQKTGDPSASQLLVVFIDDLDRCSPDNVLRVFEALKLYLDAPGFVFVIGYDSDVVSEAILERKSYSKQVTGRDYVEKIVQIVFRIPRPADEQMDELLDRYLEESGTRALFDEAECKLLIERNSRNPRRIKRFVNRFILDYRLDETSQGIDPELLITLLIFEAYFPEFAALFDASAEKNPIREFLDYERARPLIRRGAMEPIAREVLGFYEIDTEGRTSQEMFQDLDQAAPEVFVRLARDDGFLSLVRSLEGAEEQELLLSKVHRRKELGITPAVEAADLAGPGTTPVQTKSVPASRALSGARIVWIDDHPENNKQIAEWLSEGGAQLYFAADGEEAAELLAATSPELLISDITRGERGEAGFDDLGHFREEKLYEGPAIFYATRISAGRRARAADLGALITSGEDSLKELVLTTFERRQAPVA